MINMDSRLWSIGLMTGTVLDGNIDVAMLRTDGESILEVGPFALLDYPQELVELLEQTLAVAREWQFQGPEPEIFARAESALTKAQSKAVLEVLHDNDLGVGDVAVVGFHGQSVLHQAPIEGKKGNTRQLGDGYLMNRLLNIPVVFDFRTADVEAGGQGAPLAPVYHAALLDSPSVPPGSAILNLGGVANITWRDSSGNLVAFDTGPANAPINDLVRAHGLGAMDFDGELAASGSIDEQRLARLLEHAYFEKPYPKSLDRFDFSMHMADGLAVNDAAALLTAFSAAAVAKAICLLQDDVQNLIVCGGGRHNSTLLQQLRVRCGINILTADTVGLRGDAVEAECFAFLAARSIRQLPISFPMTTGVGSPQHGGKIAATFSR